MVNKYEVEVCTDIQRVAISFEQGVLAICGVEFPGRMIPARSLIAQMTLEAPGSVITMKDFGESDYLKIQSKAQIVKATKELNNFFGEVVGENVAPWHLHFDGPPTRGDSGLRTMNFLGVALAKRLMKTKDDRITMLPVDPDYISFRGAGRVKGNSQESPLLEISPKQIIITPPPFLIPNTQETNEKYIEMFRNVFMSCAVGRLISADDLVLAIKSSLPGTDDAGIRQGIRNEVERLTEHSLYTVTYNNGRLLITRKTRKVEK